MKNIHSEFAYQARELGAQIEDTLGDPPDQKHYARVIKSLVDEFAKGMAIDDVNLLSFALADHLSFDDPAGLLAQCQRYESKDTAKTLKMVSCTNAAATQALETVAAANPDLARKAVLTAFLFKNKTRWAQEDNSLDALQEEEEEKDHDEDDEEHGPGQDFVELFDERGGEDA